MSCHVIGHITVRDPALWAQYRARVPATLAPFGGQVLLRAQVHAVLAGAHAYPDVVVIAFPDRAAAAGWHASDAYQALVPLREQAADMVLIACD